VGIGLVTSVGPAASPPGRAVPEAPAPRPPAAGPPGPAALAGPGTGRSAHPSHGNHVQPRRRPSLVILADSHRRDLPAALTRDQVPHLAATTGEAIGVVGPLVLPGRSACLRCLDLTRAERDPAWPLILAQLASNGTTDPAACDAVLAATVAAQATAQALAFIDRGPAAVTVISGTLELVLPDWQWRRRTWRPHRRCGCHP
jgi:hypothetical protein